MIMGQFIGRLLSSISWGTKACGILMVGLDNAGDNSFFLAELFNSVHLFRRMFM